MPSTMWTLSLGKRKRGKNRKIPKKVITKPEWEKRLNDVRIRKQDMNKLVMKFLVAEGYVEAVEMFRTESGTEPDVDLETLADQMAIMQAVQSGNIEDAIEKVNDFNPEILDTNAQLFFHLQQQRFIELIRHGKVEDALQFAREELAPRVVENHYFLDEFQRTIALLAFEDAENSPVGELLSRSQRLKTAREVNDTTFTSQSHEKDPKLLISLLLKKLAWVQQRLDKRVGYPHFPEMQMHVTDAPEDPVV